MSNVTQDNTENILKPLSQNDVLRLKSSFDDSIEKTITSKINTKDLNDNAVNAMKRYTIVEAINRRKPSTSDFNYISKSNKKHMQKVMKSKISAPFDIHQRKEIKNAAISRYKKHGHTLPNSTQRRLYFPLISKNAPSDTEKKVAEYLTKKGYFIRDYKQGYATDINGKQEFKIGKIIKGDTELSTLFMKDDTRIADQQYLVLSNYANDIAHMSTRRGWESCMSHDGLYKEKIHHDIAGGSLIAYLIKKNDPYIFDPLARVLLKPLFNSKGDVHYHVNKCYGLHHDAFKNTAEAIAEQISNNQAGIFSLPDEVYNDGAPSRRAVFSKDTTAEEFLNLLGVKYTKDISGKITVNDNLELSGLGLNELPDLTDIDVNGNFDCRCNNLTNLIGAPQNVRGSVHCSENKLTSLIGAPQNIGDSFYCGHNFLTSLDGAPQKIEGDFYCESNVLITLNGGPQEVGGIFYCSSNQLTTLEGSPKTVGEYFSCANNQLISLEGSTKKINSHLFCYENNLTSLIGGPKEVIGDFDL